MHFTWHGELCRETEHLLFIKTPARQYAEVEQTILTHHDYDTPKSWKVPSWEA